MISKSAASVFKQQTGSNAKFFGLLNVHQRKFAGGGPKKPPMPATETNFDVVFVGKIIMSNCDYLDRWNECHCSPQVPPMRRS